MGNINPIVTSFHLPDGREVFLETGKIGTQADGSVVVRVGQTMLFASVVSAKEVKEGQSFFPLSVDYQEKFAAAGRIPGNFFRREGRLSDYEILTSRLVDRAIRPLFADEYLFETQVILYLMSGDKEEMPDALAALAASTAIAVSDIPWNGPISEVRVARVNGEFLINPKRPQLEEADIDIIVGATMADVTMVEGEAKECSEADFVEAIKLAHEQIKIQIQAQLRLAELTGVKTKREVPALSQDEELKKSIADFAAKRFESIAASASAKNDRKEAFKAVQKEFVEKLKTEKDEAYLETAKPLIDQYFEKLLKDVVRTMVLETGRRLDGRKTDEIRPIWTEIDYIPSAHGSSIFTRGETQSITTMVIGSKKDAMLVDNALDAYDESFILHYNFPPFSVGEVKPMRGPGRREVGHANLAARSLRQVVPPDLPYTIRMVSDIMESNGSSSMATVCAGSLALMDGGIQTKGQIAGIAMGLITAEGKYAILSDILGDEDALGDMDFKVTGTERGICGCQMDIKINGLPYAQLAQALEQARLGRLHILGKMNETIAQPAEDLKPHAPRVVEIEIDKSFIGAVIGTGGSVIQEIQELTGTVISIEEVDKKGIVNIASANKDGIEAALNRIRQITFVPSVGEVYEAVVSRIEAYGAFVDFNGKTGLLHVSEISHTHIKEVEDVLKLGDHVKVKMVGIDPKTGKIRLSRKALLEGPPRREGEEEGEPRHERRSDFRGGDGNRQGFRRDDRRGGGDYRRDDRNRRRD